MDGKLLTEVRDRDERRRASLSFVWVDGMAGSGTLVAQSSLPEGLSRPARPTFRKMRCP